MSWETINLKDVEQAAKGNAPALPVGEYNLRLLGAKVDTYDPTKLAFDIVVADGKYARYRIFPTLPTPKDTNDWPAQAAAKFLNTLGIEQTPGESPLDAFNRAAGNGHGVFVGTTKQYTKSNGDVKPDLEWFSVKPATV